MEKISSAKRKVLVQMQFIIKKPLKCLLLKACHTSSSLAKNGMVGKSKNRRIPVTNEFFYNLLLLLRLLINMINMNRNTMVQRKGIEIA